MAKQLGDSLGKTLSFFGPKPKPKPDLGPLLTTEPEPEEQMVESDLKEDLSIHKEFQNNQPAESKKKVDEKEISIPKFSI